MSNWHIGKKVTFWYSVKKSMVKGVIVRVNTFETMYEVDIGERIVNVHKLDLWSA